MNTTLKKGGRMSKSKKYKIKQKDFKRLEKLAEQIYFLFHNEQKLISNRVSF